MSRYLRNGQSGRSLTSLSVTLAALVVFGGGVLALSVGAPSATATKTSGVLGETQRPAPLGVVAALPNTGSGGETAGSRILAVLIFAAATLGLLGIAYVSRRRQP